MENEHNDEIELRELIQILLDKKKIIGIITVVALVVSFFYSYIILNPVYEATSTLMTSSINSGSQTSMDLARIDDMLNVMSQYPDMNMETYREQIKAPEVLSKTIEELGLEDKYTIESMGDRISLEIIKDTQMIRIKVQGEDPEKAALIVNTVSKNFIDFVTEKSKERAEATLEFVESQMEVEREKYEELLLELKEVLSQPRGATELGLELDKSYERITEYKASLNDLEIQRAGLAAALEESKSSANRGSLVARPNLEGALNISFDSSSKILATDLRSVEARILSTKDQIEILQDQIEELQVEYRDRQYEEDVINQKVNIAKNTYETFVSKYEELRVAESAKVGELSISVVSSAFVPTRPVGPRKALNMAIGLVLGLMVGVFVAFFKAYWESGEKNEAKKQDE